MITRYALFEGTIAAGEAAAFRRAVLDELVPTWRAFPGVTAIRVSFVEERDEGAPELALILAVDYPDKATLELALESEARKLSRSITQQILPRYFTGRIHHHVADLVTVPIG